MLYLPFLSYSEVIEPYAANDIFRLNLYKFVGEIKMTVFGKIPTTDIKILKEFINLLLKKNQGENNSIEIGLLINADF